MMRSVKQPQRRFPANIDWPVALKIGCFLNPVNPVQDFDFSLPVGIGGNDPIAIGEYAKLSFRQD